MRQYNGEVSGNEWQINKEGRLTKTLCTQITYNSSILQATDDHAYIMIYGTFLTR